MQYALAATLPKLQCHCQLEKSQSLHCTMNSILQLVDSLRPDELIWLCLHDRPGVFFWLGAAWVKSRAERPSVSGVNRQLHVQIGCKLGIRNRKDELTKQAKRTT